MLLQNKSFYINEYKIPEFTLAKGEMIRFWVEITPELDDNTNGYWGTKKMQEAIRVFNQRNKIIKICPNQIQRGISDFIKPISVGRYLKNKFQIKEKEVNEILSQFDIKPEFKIRNLGTTHQKVFSIICGFQKNQVVSFDYHGLSPNTEEQLTKFAKQQLKKGKAAISFDNLYFKPDKCDSENITNLEIRRQGENEN